MRIERNAALQCWNNVVTIQNNVATMLQRCVSLKSLLRLVPGNITFIYAASNHDISKRVAWVLYICARVECEFILAKLFLCSFRECVNIRMCYENEEMIVAVNAIYAIA